MPLHYISLSDDYATILCSCWMTNNATGVLKNVVEIHEEKWVYAINLCHVKLVLYHAHSSYLSQSYYLWWFSKPWHWLGVFKKSFYPVQPVYSVYGVINTYVAIVPLWHFVSFIIHRCHNLVMAFSSYYLIISALLIRLCPAYGKIHENFPLTKMFVFSCRNGAKSTFYFCQCISFLYFYNVHYKGCHLKYKRSVPINGCFSHAW